MPILPHLIYFGIYLKRRTEQIIMYPFILYGKWLAKKQPLTHEFDVFYFQASYGIGGAELCNVEILKTIPELKVLIIKTKISSNAILKPLFEMPNTTLTDISVYADNKLKYWNSFIYRGIYAYYINSQKRNTIVFNGQSNFAYKLLPWLNKNIKTAEIIHCDSRKFGLVTLPYITFLQKRVMIADTTHRFYMNMYKEFGIPKKCNKRATVILNKVDEFAALKSIKKTTGDIQIVYAGRGGFQKRLWIIFKIVEKCLALNLPVQFHFAGSFEEEIPQHLKNKITYYGQLQPGLPIHQLLKDKHILIMTSIIEGFPLVIMEAMMNKTVCLTTAVSGIPEFITHEKNGLLIYKKQEEEIVQNAVEEIKKGIDDRQRLTTIADEAYAYVNKHFNSAIFTQRYRELFLSW